MDASWFSELNDFCFEHNIPIEDLHLICDDPKVIPMIRGKAFEFSLARLLRENLPASFEVSTPYMNAQQGLHDIDVLISHNQTGKKWKIECKLAKKGSFMIKSGVPMIRVKCMRSRTLGPAKIKELSPIWGYPEPVLKIHNDQYRGVEFDIVATSLANAFYITDEDGKFVFRPSKINGGNGQQFVDFNRLNQKTCFDTVFFARADSIRALRRNSVQCTRGKCDDPDCGFIPNYPIIEFSPRGGIKPKPPWVTMEDLHTIL
tara:strand:- start:338 stop:1117 length:780 start_codon:yes stop_codon:yes gene_type:complete